MTEVLGIVGQGFVGGAVREGMKNHFKIETYDVISEKSTTNSLNELCYKVDVLFVCVPTPMRKSGECDISIVDSVLNQINSLGQSKIVILKSTVPPGTCDKLQSKYDNIDLIFNPEFLTEANAVNDFINQDRIILGGKNETSLNTVGEMFQKVFPTIPIIKTTATTSEMVKYVANCFLSVKVTFANQFFDMCNSVDVDYNEVISISKLDTRLGHSHWKVPGPDGDRGYGGHCFPKDMSALLYLAKQNNVDLSIIEESINYNNRIRINRDWENMQGRAISNE